LHNLSGVPNTGSSGVSNINQAIKRPLEVNDRNESSHVAERQRKTMKPRSMGIF
jgi:hypothetical protein